MKCKCVGCIKDAQGSQQEYCDYHSLLSVQIGANLKRMTKYSRAYTMGNNLAVAIAEGKTPPELAKLVKGVSAKGILKMLIRRYGSK